MKRSRHNVRVLVPLVFLLVMPWELAAQDFLVLGPGGVQFGDSTPTAVTTGTSGLSVRSRLSVRSDPDVRWLRRIHSWDSAFARNYLGAVDATAYPVILAAPVSAVLVASRSDRLNRTDVVFVASTWGTTVLAMQVLKRVIARPRPFAALPDISARVGYAGTRNLEEHASMPSGHAMLAAAVATSAFLLAPRWYVVVPAVVWAGSVSVSRVWLGVHYPSDVLVGTALGAAIAASAYLIIQ